MKKNYTNQKDIPTWIMAISSAILAVIEILEFILKHT